MPFNREEIDCPYCVVAAVQQRRMTEFPLPSLSSHSTFLAQLSYAHSFTVLVECFYANYLNQWDVNCGLEVHT